MPRENSKCRNWEKNRRDRLKEAFTELAKVLPCYDPSVNISKMDILQKATSNIRELEDNIKRLLSSNTEKKTETEDIIKKLNDRIKKLLVRNEQLSNLLRDAGISVPSVCGTIKRFKKPLYWSKKYSPEQAKLLLKNEMEKENISSKLVHGKKKKTRSVNTGITPKHRTTVSNEVKRKEMSQKRKKNNKKTATSNCFIVLSQPTTTIRTDLGQPVYLVTNQPSSNNTCKGVVDKSGIDNPERQLKPLVVSSKSKISKNLLHTNPTISSLPPLGPGTLVLANGTLVSILPHSQPMLRSFNFLLNPEITNSLKTKDEESNQKLTASKNVIQTSVVSNVRTLPKHIQPKYCLTRTTQVNKVPIPALTSRYANNYLLLNETKTEYSKEKEITKIKKSNKTSQIQELNKIEKKKADKRKNEFEDESNSKRNKNDCKNKSTSDLICKSISDSIISPSTSFNSSSIKEDDSVKLKVANNSKNTNNDLVEKIITDKPKEGKIEYKDNHSDQNAQLENIEVTVSTSDCFEKKGLAKQVESENPHEMLIVSSSVPTATTTTTSTQDDMKHLDLNLSHSELSNDIFASLQVPSGCQNPDSTSPTAAFLLAFPLVSTGIKVTEVIDEDNSESQRGTPTLLQIGTMDSTKPTQSQSDIITTNFLNFDNFSFLSSKDVSGNFYNNYSNTVNKPDKSTLPISVPNTNNKSDPDTNKSLYVNIKSPCLQTSVAEPAKENYNLFDQKAANTKEIVRNIDGCEKRSTNQKAKDNNLFLNNSHSQPNSKVNSNYIIHSKNTDHLQKNIDQKSQFYVPTTYPNSNCNFNYKNDPSKMCTTCSYMNMNRNYTNPLYTNCSNYNYNYHPDTNFSQNYYKNIPRNEAKGYYPLSYENYPDYRKNETTSLTGRYDTSSYVKEKRNNNVKVKTTCQSKLPINWMTTPDTRLQSSECLLTSFSKGDFTQTYPFSSYVTSSSTYFTTSMDTNEVNCVMEAKKCLDLPTVSLNSHQRPDTEEKQFSWSPTKLPHFLDPPHNFVTSTLPTLVGDLALGNPLTFGDQKNDYNKLGRENKDFRRTNKINNYENQTNFFSVSQLVDHNKPENIPAKSSTRRNSGNRSKNNMQQKIKRVPKHENKDLLSNCSNNSDKTNSIRPTNNYNSNEIFQEHKNRNSQKNTSSNYSAEALIGNQIPDETVTKRYTPPSSKSLGGSTFLTENIISYFPPVDLPQENYITQNQNYPTSNFTHNLNTSFQNNTYSTNSFIYTAPTITSTYLSTNNFEPGLHDYLQDNLNLVQNTTTKDNKHYISKNYNNRQQNKDDKTVQHNTCLNNSKRQRKKQTNENNNGLTNFEFSFLSVPGSNNSPILPDDFHSHTNFFPPTTPFTCKNAIYPKQSNDIHTGSLLPLPPVSRSNIQHPEISPSINSVGTSLTNFNLSTIFPEINKGHIPEIYPDVRGNKEQSHSKSYTSASPQVPFNTEPKFSFSS